ncbi:MAG TPA: hypothetical protein VEQ84_09870 [Vicinamibacteria bacterium]|nr:hypothetical protein [Vicinamibacteria bacterium]
MASAWPELDELIRALADVCALPRSEEEPSLSEATIAVGKATADLARAAGSRGRATAAARARAASSIEEARAAVEHARRAIAASARRTSGARAASAPAGPPVEGQAEATCPACGRPFVVRYRAAMKTPTVAFPVACPLAKCDGITSVEYPASAVDVNVDAVPA